MSAIQFSPVVPGWPEPIIATKLPLKYVNLRESLRLETQPARMRPPRVRGSLGRLEHWAPFCHGEFCQHTNRPSNLRLSQVRWAIGRRDVPEISELGALPVSNPLLPPDSLDWKKVQLSPFRPLPNPSPASVAHFQAVEHAWSQRRLPAPEL